MMTEVPLTLNAAASARPHECPDTLGLRGAALLLVAALVVLAPGMGVSLVDRDEGWYAEVCREMVASGEWLVPCYLGEIWLAKPPLLYWLVATSFEWFGVGEWQARLVPVLASAANVLLVASLAAGMFGRQVGLFAGVLFITCGLSAITGRMLLTDSLMLLCTLTAVVLHWCMAVRGVRHLRAALYWIAIGLGVLAKGPAVLVFAGAFGLAIFLFGRRRQHRRSDPLAAPRTEAISDLAPTRDWLLDWRFWLWAPLAAAVAAPWYVYVFRLAGATLRQQFFGYEILSRIAGAPHGHSGPPGYYLVLSLAGLLPWTVFVPGTLIAGFAAARRPLTAGSPDTRERERIAVRVLLLWLALPWLVLELLNSKLPHYILPCYVPLAILLGREVAAVPRGAARWTSIPKPQRGVLVLWALVCGLIAAAVLVTSLGFRWHGRSPQLSDTLGLCAAAVMLSLLAGVYRCLRRGEIRFALIFGLCFAVSAYLTLGLALLHALEPYRLSRELAAKVNALAQPGDGIYFCGYEEPSTFFYTNQRAQPIGPEDMPLLVANQRPRVFAITTRAWERIDPTIQAQLKPLVTGHLSGMNYVKWQPTTVLLGRLPDGGEKDAK